jgi:hypothetical protein
MKGTLLCVFLMLMSCGSGFAQPAKMTKPAFYVVLNSLKFIACS